MFRSRQVLKQVLFRLDKLEEQYQIQEQQVKNLLQLLKEYKDELDRRKRSYKNLLLQTGVSLLTILIVVNIAPT